MAYEFQLSSIILVKNSLSGSCNVVHTQNELLEPRRVFLVVTKVQDSRNSASALQNACLSVLCRTRCLVQIRPCACIRNHQRERMPVLHFLDPQTDNIMILRFMDPSTPLYFAFRHARPRHDRGYSRRSIKKLRQLEYEVSKSWGQTLRCQHTFQALQWHSYNGS